MFHIDENEDECDVENTQWMYMHITKERMKAILRVGKKKHSPSYIRRLYCMELLREAMIDVYIFNNYRK